MAIGVLTLVIVILLTVIVRRRRPAGDLSADAPMPHGCGASNPLKARFCRRCGEALMLDLALGPLGGDE